MSSAAFAAIFQLLRRWLRTEEDDNVADARDQVAAAFLGQLRGDFFFLVLEAIELHLDKVAMLQRGVQRSEEAWAETLLAHLQRGLEPLGLGLEISYLRVGERNHRAKVREFAQHAIEISSNANLALPKFASFVRLG